MDVCMAVGYIRQHRTKYSRHLRKHWNAHAHKLETMDFQWKPTDDGDKWKILCWSCKWWVTVWGNCIKCGTGDGSSSGSDISQKRGSNREWERKEAYNAVRALNLRNKITLDDVSFYSYHYYYFTWRLLTFFYYPYTEHNSFFSTLLLKMDLNLNDLRLCINTTKQFDWFHSFFVGV